MFLRVVIPITAISVVFIRIFVILLLKIDRSLEDFA
jgi:hypothetical protein